MNVFDTLQRLRECGIVAIVRGTSADVLGNVLTALRNGGVRAVEVTLDTPGACSMIERLAQDYGDSMLVGAGTVLDPETARAAILAGATFVLSPTLNPKVIQMCRRYGVLAVPGAATPTEILTAWDAGASMVKVFPARVFGPSYIKDIRGPLPQVELMPVGGVGLDNVDAFIHAGAAALGVGGELVSRRLVMNQAWSELEARAAAFVQAVARARAGI